MFTESDFKGFGDDQGFKWDEGFTIDCLVTFQHNGDTIVNPYSYTQRDPAEMFGVDKMNAWKAEAADLMREWMKDAGIAA